MWFMLGTTKKTSYFQDTLGGKAMVKKKTNYPLFHEFRIMKIGNILLNTSVEDLIEEEIEETKILISQVKDINQLVRCR